MSGSIFITLGQGVEFGIDEFNNFVLTRVQGGKVIQMMNLGHATEKHLDTMILHMGSLRIHTERN